VLLVGPFLYGKIIVVCPSRWRLKGGVEVTHNGYVPRNEIKCGLWSIDSIRIVYAFLSLIMSIWIWIPVYSFCNSNTFYVWIAGATNPLKKTREDLCVCDEGVWTTKRQNGVWMFCLFLFYIFSYIPPFFLFCMRSRANTQSLTYLVWCRGLLISCDSQLVIIFFVSLICSPSLLNQWPFLLWMDVPCASLWFPYCFDHLNPFCFQESGFLNGLHFVW